MTKIIGKREANATRPNPSVKGVLPSKTLERPTPNAATKGTVMVEVVTPPASYAIPMISLGANSVIIITSTYPDTIITWSFQPLMIRKTPIEMASPTDKATASLRPKTKEFSEPSGIRFDFENTRAASLLTANRDGSAIVVEKPNKKLKHNNQNKLPFFAKVYAKFSPIGNNPNSKPSTNNINPTKTQTSPSNTSVKLGNGWRMTKI